jgi:hypothetical protein
MEYLMIGGAIKSGTTSLFYYLADHPDIKSATVKETRFFLDDDYPITRVGSGPVTLQTYKDFFHRQKENEIGMEATPFYLYSAGTAQRIFDHVPKSKMLFILREPMAQLSSGIRYLQQNGDFPENKSVDDFVKENIELLEYNKNLSGTNAVSMSCYVQFLKRYYELFGNDRVKVIYFEDLLKNPEKVLDEVCGFIGLDSSFYSNYTFKIYNQTVGLGKYRFVKKLNNVRNYLVRFTYKRPVIHNRLKQIKLKLEQCLQSGESNVEDFKLSEGIRVELINIYQSERVELEKLTQSPVPWK